MSEKFVEVLRLALKQACLVRGAQPPFVPCLVLCSVPEMSWLFIYSTERCMVGRLTSGSDAGKRREALRGEASSRGACMRMPKRSIK